jgi:hypothetical protein
MSARQPIDWTLQRISIQRNGLFKTKRQRKTSAQ